MNKKMHEVRTILLNNYEEILKRIIFISTYIYIYYNIIYLMWRVLFKIYLDGITIYNLFLIASYILLSILPFIYKKNELYLMLFLILILQLF